MWRKRKPSSWPWPIPVGLVDDGGQYGKMAAGRANGAGVVCLRALHFPIQNVEKISPRSSSLVNSP